MEDKALNRSRLELDPCERDQIRTQISLSFNKPIDFDDEIFLKDLPLTAFQQPEKLVKFLNEFKYNPIDDGYCIVSTGMVVDEKLGLTPPHWELKTNNDTCHDAVITMCLCASIIGDIYGWQTQQDGRVVHDILPIKNNENEQLGSGSKKELMWHVEDAFHELRGDYLMMMCLRNNDGISTTVSKPDYTKLNDEQLDILFEKKFTIRPDTSHYQANCSSERFTFLQSESEAESAKVREAYAAMNNRTTNPKKVAVLFGNRKNPCIRLDPHFMETPRCNEDADALGALIDLVDESLIDITLDPGDLLILDNFKVVHGRRAFKPRYDGTDRWFKRINIVRDIRKCHEALESTLSRTIY